MLNVSPDKGYLNYFKTITWTHGVYLIIRVFVISESRCCHCNQSLMGIFCSFLRDIQTKISYMKIRLKSKMTTWHYMAPKGLGSAIWLTDLNDLLIHFMVLKGSWHSNDQLQYNPRNMHTVFALLYFVVIIHWLIFPYPSGLLHLHCGNLTIAPVPAKQPWWIWINTSCEFIMSDCITTTKQSTTKPCAYFLGYTVFETTAILLQCFKPFVQANT